MKIATAKGVETVIAATSEFQSSLLAPDIINVVRGLRLNNLRVPKWIALEYNAIEERHISMPVVPQVRLLIYLIYQQTDLINPAILF